MKNLHALLIFTLFILVMGGCGGHARVNLTEHTGGSAALYQQFQAFDGHTGHPLTFAEIARRCAASDVVFFGEQHSDAVCNAVAAQVFHGLLQRSRPAALAMEFFERDTQAALDAYLAGQSDEAAFITATRQNRDYLLAHRPLVELCRTAGAPILAANAPRRLVREFRMSKMPFDAFRKSRSAEDQRWLPRASEHLAGPYFQRFLEAVKDHPTAPPTPTSGPALLPLTEAGGAAIASTPAHPAASDTDSHIVSFRPMLLWDDSMAESVADYRAAHGGHRVMLVVGRFHVASEGGTLQKFRQRRPHDRICTIVYSSRPTGAFALDKEDADSADIVICGLTPPKKSDGPAATTTMPATAPARDHAASGAKPPVSTVEKNGDKPPQH